MAAVVILKALAIYLSSSARALQGRGHGWAVVPAQNFPRKFDLSTLPAAEVGRASRISKLHGIL